MIKNILLIITLIFGAFNETYSKDFEGLIIYQYQYLDSLGKDVTEEIGQESGLEQHYYIDSENYKSFDENGIITQLYNSKTNTYYYKIDEKIRSIDGNFEYPKSFNFELTNDTLTILGVKCNSLKKVTESTETVYYFSKTVATNSKKFNNHKFGNWAEYMINSKGALPLMYVLKRKDSTVIAKAIKIESLEFDESDFDIEKILKVKKIK